MANTDLKDKIKLLDKKELEFLRLKCTGAEMTEIEERLQLWGDSLYRFQKKVIEKLGFTPGANVKNFWRSQGVAICTALYTSNMPEPPPQEETQPFRSEPHPQDSSILVVPQEEDWEDGTWEDEPPRDERRRNRSLFVASAVFLLCLCLGVTGVAIWRFIGIPGISRRATPEAAVQAPTQLPAVVDIPTTRVIVVTSTAPVEVVSLPTDIPDPVVIPTNTNVPTPTDIPFTPTPTEIPVLSIGSQIKGQTLKMILTEIEINSDYNTGAHIFRWVASFYYTMEASQSNQIDMLFHVDNAGFTMTDDLDHQYVCYFLAESGFDKNAFSLDKVLSPGDIYRIQLNCGYEMQLDPDAQTLTVYTPAFESLPEATWVVELP